MQITPLLSPASKTAETTQKTNVTADYNKFLTLLTAQLQNQDPLAPMDASQFTNQLVQFAQVEQSVNMNKGIGDILKLQEQGQVQDAVGYVGRTVDVLGSEFTLKNGKAEILYAVDGTAAETTVQIFDGKGTLVRTLGGTAGSGLNRFAWDGKNALGGTAADGLYRVQVTAKDKDGKALETQTGYSGEVSRVENVDGSLMLTVGGQRIPMSQIVSVGVTAKAA